jgi:hypothetical protein
MNDGGLGTWPTVALALGVAVVGLAAGVITALFALRVARLNIEHEELQAWGTRQFDAGTNFANLYIALLRDIAEQVVARQPFDQDARESITNRALKLIEALIPVQLVFGAGSEPARIADAAPDEVRRALELYDQSRLGCACGLSGCGLGVVSYAAFEGNSLQTDGWCHFRRNRVDRPRPRFVP